MSEDWKVEIGRHGGLPLATGGSCRSKLPFFSDIAVFNKLAYIESVPCVRMVNSQFSKRLKEA